MIDDLLKGEAGLSDEAVLAKLDKHPLGELCQAERELLRRRQNVRLVFGHLNSPFLDAVSPGNREYMRLVRLSDLVKVAISRKHFPAATDPPAKGTRRGYREEVRAWMKRKELETVEEAARSLGVSSSTLKSIMTSKGQQRYCEATLQSILEKIGVRAQDLQKG